MKGFCSFWNRLASLPLSLSITIRTPRLFHAIAVPTPPSSSAWNISDIKQLVSLFLAPVFWIIEVELSCLCIGCLHVSRLSMQEDALENAVPHRVFLEAYRICHAWPVRSLSIVHHRCFLFVSACSSACLGGSYGPAMCLCCLCWKEPAARPTASAVCWADRKRRQESRQGPCRHSSSTLAASFKGRSKTTRAAWGIRVGVIPGFVPRQISGNFGDTSGRASWAFEKPLAAEFPWQSRARLIRETEPSF